MKEMRKTLKRMTLMQRPVMLAAVLLFVPVAGNAQLQPPAEGTRLSAAVGAWAPRDAAIAAAGGDDTRLTAGPAFGLEFQYDVASFAALFVNGTTAVPTLRRGIDIQPAAAGSGETTIVSATGGVVFGLSGLHPNILPTLRLGGGMKYYSFDLTGADSHIRPTGDVGIGFRGIGTGPIEVGADIRYLFSSFDQSHLPTRGITPQNQRQTDLLFSVGFAVRLSGPGQRL